MGVTEYKCIVIDTHWQAVSQILQIKSQEKISFSHVMLHLLSYQARLTLALSDSHYFLNINKARVWQHECNVTVLLLLRLALVLE